LKMATAMFTETMDNSQHSTRLIPESRSYTLNSNRENLKTRTSLVSNKVKKKVKLSRYTPCRRIGREEVQLLLILKLGTRWGWVVSVTPRPRFTPGERTPGTHWIGGWVGPRARLEAGVRRKIFT
jgi:hypothetical protein